MTARSPLWYNSGNLQEMTAAEIVQWQVAAIYVYASSPTVVLTINTGSAGNLAAINDTRLQAGAMSSNANAFVAESGTAEPSIVNVAYDRIHRARTTSGVGQTADTAITFPVWYNSGTIQAMTLTDFKDTFVSPAITLLVAASESNNTGGTYTISTATSVSGYTLISGTPVFTDTRANTGAYTAAGIPETLDQPTTITNYYLHRRNGADSTPSRNLLLAEGGTGGLIEGATATMKSLIGNWIRYDAANTSGQKILYGMATSGAGNTRGSGIVDTRLNGAGFYQQKLINANDYRSQEFPNGSAATIATYNLRIVKGG
jgi:hypothetical protein